MKNILNTLFLSKEVRDALKESKQAANYAMEAKQTIDSIYVTEKLADMFGKSERDVADALKEDYYTELLIWKMLKEKQEQEAEETATA